MSGKRDFGRIRQLPSGRWQARYPGPDGVDRPAPRTVERKRDPADWLAEKRIELARDDDWLDVVPELHSHLSWFSEPGPEGLVFVGPLGGRLLRRDFRRLWAEALRTVGLDPATVHFHGLRHTGNPPGSRHPREHEGADGTDGPLHDARR
jgi:integrase